MQYETDLVGRGGTFRSSKLCDRIHSEWAGSWSARRRRDLQKVPICQPCIINNV